jgi:hypothetical protein
MNTSDREFFEAEINAEVALAESSAPREALAASDADWRPNPEEVLAYEARLATLRGAYEALADPPAATAPPVE